VSEHIKQHLRQTLPLTKLGYVTHALGLAAAFVRPTELEGAGLVCALPLVAAICLLARGGVEHLADT
jgi:hypothetical protein